MSLSLPIPCYFLLNYARKAKSHQRSRHTSDNLLFSFELCLTDTLCTVADPACFHLLFSFELCGACWAGILGLSRASTTCYFLLNYAHPLYNVKLSKSEKLTCYFLLNYAYSYNENDLVYAIVLTCYFLLNYAIIVASPSPTGSLAIFFWIMQVESVLEAKAEKRDVACYFLLNYARHPRAPHQTTPSLC